MRKYTVIRDITTEECPWLENTILKGQIVYSYTGCTYGCIGHNGKAVSLELGVDPFFELPYDSIK